MPRRAGEALIRRFRRRIRGVRSSALAASPFQERMIPSVLPPCPYLPPPLDGLDHQHLGRHGESRDAAFYLSCLEYGNSLWLRGLAARAVLCLDRAMGADLDGTEPQLEKWPIPYAAMAWFLAHTPPEVFIGNPRVHFQHYADRMNQPRRDVRIARAWACWAIARRLRPEWPADPKHRIVEPSLEMIAASLSLHGHAGEPTLWRRVLDSCAKHHLAEIK